ncbi:DNA internalization-related competence protein ComEC/Rec2, partial [bacterium]|nr:DNA internalization-related competence protein ComEC/Rec2 [bacterium]
KRLQHSALQWAQTQWAITLGLAPASLLLFSQISLVAPLANAIAIPWVSVVVTPLALLAAISAACSTSFAFLAAEGWVGAIDDLAGGGGVAVTL